MTNALVVILGLFVGVLGAALVAWPTFATREKEITRRSMGELWWVEASFLLKERKFARLGVVVIIAGASLQTVGALVL